MDTNGSLLDKSVFLATNMQKLCDFAKRHTLVLTETLFYECYTSKDISNKKLLKRLNQLLKNGAYPSYQFMQIVGDEGENLCPCTSIIDYSRIEELRTNMFREEYTISKEEVARIKNDRSKIATAIVKFAKRSLELELKQPGYLKEIRRLNMNRPQRFRQWFEKADKSDIHDLAVKIFRKHIADPKRFCLSSEWLSWHYMRLIYAWGLEYSYLETRGGCPMGERAEHDSMDIEYLAFFAKVDVLLTKDVKHQEVAQAAFPNKKICSGVS